MEHEETALGEAGRRFSNFLGALGAGLAGREFQARERESSAANGLFQMLAQRAISNPEEAQTQAFQDLAKKLGGFGPHMQAVVGMSAAWREARANRQRQIEGQLNREVGAARAQGQRSVARPAVALQRAGQQMAESRLAQMPPKTLPEPLRYARSLGPGGVQGTAVDPGLVGGVTGVPQVTPQAIASAASQAGEAAAEERLGEQEDIRGLLGSGMIDEAGQAIVARPAARRALLEARAKASSDRVDQIRAFVGAGVPANVAPAYRDHLSNGGSMEDMPAGLAGALQQAGVDPKKVPAAGVAASGWRERVNKVLAQHADIAKDSKGSIPPGLAPTLEAQLQSANADYITSVLPEKAKALFGLIQEGKLSLAEAQAQLQDDVRMSLLVWTKNKDGWIPWSGGQQKGPRVLGVVAPGEAHSTNLSGVADLGEGNRIIIGATGELGFDGPAFEALAAQAGGGAGDKTPKPDGTETDEERRKREDIESALGVKSGGAEFLDDAGNVVGAVARGAGVGALEALATGGVSYPPPGIAAGVKAFERAAAKRDVTLRAPGFQMGAVPGQPGAPRFAATLEGIGAAERDPAAVALQDFQGAIAVMTPVNRAKALLELRRALKETKAADTARAALLRAKIAVIEKAPKRRTG